MEEVILADRYAKALIAVAEEMNLIGRLDSELNNFLAILKKKPQLEQILRSPLISLKEKRELLQSILKQQKTSPQFKHFLYLLLKMRRFHLFGKICKIYKDLIYSLRKKMKVFVECAFPLDAKQKSALKKRLSRIYQRNIELSVRQNAQLIGGAKVYVGHTLFDGTVQSRLGLLRKRLWRE